MTTTRREQQNDAAIRQLAVSVTEMAVNLSVMQRLLHIQAKATVVSTLFESGMLSRTAVTTFKDELTEELGKLRHLSEAAKSL